MLLEDLRLAARALVRRPGLAAIALLMLSVSLGANTAIYSIVNTLLIRPYPYRSPSGLVTIWTVQPERGISRANLSYPDFLFLQVSDGAFSRLAVYHQDSFDLLAGGEVSRISGGKVSAGFFSVLGVEPLHGRSFNAKEDQPGGDKVVILSEKLWRDTFGSRAGVVGQKLFLGGEPLTVIGVMPAAADMPNGALLWVPLAARFENESFAHTHLSAIARLKEGVSLAQAETSVETISRRLAREYPQIYGGRSFRIIDLRSLRVGNLRLVFLVLQALVGAVLLIACANVANLLLARDERRRKEIAVAVVLGASPGRIVRQLLTESALIGLASGVLGLLLGYWGVHRLVALVPVEMPSWVTFDVDVRVVAFTFTVSLLAVLLFGLVPARQAGRLDIAELLRDAGPQATSRKSGRRLRTALTVVEVTLSLVLLVGAGLMIRSFLRLKDTDPGFPVHRLLTFELDLKSGREVPDAELPQRLEAVLGRLAAVPGVQAVGAASDLPMILSGNTTDFTVVGQTPDEYKTNPFALNVAVSLGLLRGSRHPAAEG